MTVSIYTIDGGITVLVVNKRLCGFVSNQVQYNMDRAQYIGLSYYIL